MCIATAIITGIATTVWGVIQSAAMAAWGAVQAVGLAMGIGSAAAPTLAMGATGMAAPAIGGATFAMGASGFAVGAGTAGLSWGTIGAIGLGVLAVGGAAAGGIMGTVSSIQNAQMQEAQAEYMQEVEANNARMAARQAESVGLQGNQELTSLRNKMLQTKGEARNAYAASGVVLGSGSSADYEADIADAYDLDSRNLEYDIASRKWKLQVQSSNASDQSALYKAQAGGYRSQQTTSLLGGMFGTTGSVMSAAGGTFGMSSQFGWI